MNGATKDIILAIVGSTAFFGFLIVIANNYANKKKVAAEAEKISSEAKVIRITGDMNLSGNILEYTEKLEARLTKYEDKIDRSEEKIKNMELTLDRNISQNMQLTAMIEDMQRSLEEKDNIILQKDIEMGKLKDRVTKLEETLKASNIPFDI